MNEIQKKIQEAYRHLSAIPVSGDGVEVMAAARIRLRGAYELAATRQKEEKNG